VEASVLGRAACVCRECVSFHRAQISGHGEMVRGPGSGRDTRDALACTDINSCDYFCGICPYRQGQ